MSLKAFHIFFISICSLLSLFLIVWGIWDFQVTRTGLSLGLAILGGLGLVLLTRYLKWFRQKIKDIVIGLAVGLAGGFLGWITKAQACAVCFQDPDSLMTKGALTGVAVLLAIVVTVLVLIALVARSWIKRAHKMSAHL